MKKISKYLDVISVFFLALLVAHMLIYIFANSRSLMNSDSAFVIDYGLEQIRTKSFFPKNWIHTNDFWIYSLIPIVTPLLKIGVNYFLSRQVSVFIQTVLLFLVMYDLFKNELKDKQGFKLLFFFMLSGISGQFLFEIFGDASYGSITFYMLLCVWLIIKYFSKGKKVYLVLFVIILLLLTSCSLRFPIYIASPIICCILYFLYNKGINKKYLFVLGIISIAIVGGFFFNKYLNSRSLVANYTDSVHAVKDADLLKNSTQETIFNYLTIMGSTNLNVITLNNKRYNDQVLVASPLIVLTFIRFIFAIVTFLIPILLFKKVNEMTENEKILYIYTISLTFILLFFNIIGKMSKWYRYITPVIFFLILLYPLFYKFYFSKEKKKQIVFSLASLMFILSSFYFSISSYYSFQDKKLIRNETEELTNFLLSKDLHYGFADITMDHNIHNLLSNGKLRVNGIYNSTQPLYWLNSKDWFDNSYYDGKVFLMVRKFEMIDYVKDAIEQYEYDKYAIYVFPNMKYITRNLDFTNIKTNDNFIE